ncbi:PREDICTED: RNA polymerase II subunit 5-mediating protein homolog [Camelina sativa]|uniref:RNA polymerase II subunit 5-mediating protein homolog n=1 Tax=Camelina sativa TaxID=90675 RepID=A0ABM1RBX5_CAMSA|nr:PREDICTED: RNA polymerase II subunit 5-mediating protein homolog [Camelina sativa]
MARLVLLRGGLGPDNFFPQNSGRSGHGLSVAGYIVELGSVYKVSTSPRQRLSVFLVSQLKFSYHPSTITTSGLEIQKSAMESRDSCNLRSLDVESQRIVDSANAENEREIEINEDDDVNKEKSPLQRKRKQSNRAKTSKPSKRSSNEIEIDDDDDDGDKGKSPQQRKRRQTDGAETSKPSKRSTIEIDDDDDDGDDGDKGNSLPKKKRR